MADLEDTLRALQGAMQQTQIAQAVAGATAAYDAFASEAMRVLLDGFFKGRVEG